MWEIAIAIAGTIPASIYEDMLNARPGGIVRVSNPRNIQFLPRPEASADCKGCGAPLKSYIHHCEYCRRSI